MNTNITAGYNPLMVETLLAAVRNNYSEFKEEANKLNSEYINALAASWYSQEVYDYFNDTFKPKMDEIYSDIYSLTNASLEKISNAQKAWAGLTNTADNTGTSTLNDDMPQCDVSAIKAQQDDGTRGVNVSEVEALTTVLSNCFDAQIKTISKMESSVKGNEFIGGDQTEELLSRFRETRKKMTSLLENTKKDIDDHINTAINEYLDLGSNTSNKFSIDGKNVDFSRITNNSADSLNGQFWSEGNINKDHWGDNKSGKLEYEIKENGSVLITEDGVPMGWTDKKGLINAMSKEKTYIPLASEAKSQPTPQPTQSTPTSTSSTLLNKEYHDNWGIVKETWKNNNTGETTVRTFDQSTGKYLGEETNSSSSDTSYGGTGGSF